MITLGDRKEINKKIEGQYYTLEERRIYLDWLCVNNRAKNRLIFGE